MQFGLRAHHVQDKWRHFVQMVNIRSVYRRAHSLGNFHNFCRKLIENYEAKVSLSFVMPSDLDVQMH